AAPLLLAKGSSYDTTYGGNSFGNFPDDFTTTYLRYGLSIKSMSYTDSSGTTDIGAVGFISRLDYSTSNIATGVGSVEVVPIIDPSLTYSQPADRHQAV